MLTRLRIRDTSLTHGSMMVESEARCEECQEPLTVAHLEDRCAAFSDQRHLYLSPPHTLKIVVEEDCGIESPYFPKGD